jgi:type II secretory pathway pseudopilin PulG
MKQVRHHQTMVAARQEDAMRKGTTLIEVGVTICILGLTASLTFPRFTSYRDRIAVDAATSSTLALLATARHAALRRATRTAVHFDTTGAIVLVVAGVDTIERRPLRDIHGVNLATTRDSIAFAPSGLGYGAANTQIILRRGTRLTRLPFRASAAPGDDGTSVQPVPKSKPGTETRGIS